MKQPVLKSDWWSLAIIGVLFVAWLVTGRVWLKHLMLGCTFLYFLVVRIVARNLNKK